MKLKIKYRSKESEDYKNETINISKSELLEVGWSTRRAYRLFYYEVLSKKLSVPVWLAFPT